MQPFSSRELFIMNGGNKLYIHKDGFGDIYNATAAEEKEWTNEIIINALAKIEKEETITVLRFAIDSLQFHKYPPLKNLLIDRIEEASPLKQVVLATALWSIFKYSKSFEIINQNLQQHQSECLDAVFLGLIEFKKSVDAKKLLIQCLQNDDDTIFEKAYITINTWAYTGMPELRENNLLELLKLENKNKVTFRTAFEQLKKCFEVSEG